MIASRARTWIMNHVSSKIVALAISIFAAGPLLAEEALPIRNCAFCHGTSAQGYATAPRLAGQKSQYIEKELGTFAEHVRDNPLSKKYMWNAVANLAPGTAHDLAAYFSTQPPRPANDGNKDLAAAGKNIYEFGIPDANVVACVVCHAPNGEGVRDIPRLGGMSYLYVKRRLDQWNEGFHPTARPMPQVARSLSATEIDALASYLSFVE
jgi:cytochrome c553